MENLFLRKVRHGGKCIGTFSWVGKEMIMEGLAYAGMDFVIIDTEHSALEAESVQNLVRVAKMHNITPFVRSKDCSRPAILKMLDAGAQGLIIPQVQTVDEVKKVVEYGKYYPTGQHGVAIGCSGGYGYEPFAAEGLQNYFNKCNEQTLLFPQCETRCCLEHIEEIVHIDGVDGIFIGPYDLSVALGEPGQLKTSKFTSAIERVKEAVKAAKKYVIMYTSNEEDIVSYFNDGFDAVTWTTDIKLFISLIQKEVQKVKSNKNAK